MSGTIDRPVKIGTAARLLGVAESTLRFYEQEKLVVPVRSEGGTRLYYPRHLRQLRAIRALLDAGVPLEQVRALMHARKGGVSGEEGRRDVAPVLKQRLEDVRRQRIRLQELERQLREALALVEGCRGCSNIADSRHCPDCPVNRHREEVPVVELFWD